MLREKEKTKKKWDNLSFSVGYIIKAARLKGTQGCMWLGAAVCLGDESSSEPDTW